jgi:hypothetical protein
VQNCAILCETDAGIPDNYVEEEAAFPRKKAFQRKKTGGRGGIRTHGGFNPTLDFEPSALEPARASAGLNPRFGASDLG